MHVAFHRPAPAAYVVLEDGPMATDQPPPDPDYDEAREILGDVPGGNEDTGTDEAAFGGAPLRMPGENPDVETEL